MSSEVVKKRGRPKKVIPELVEVEVEAPEVVKKATRAKSTKAAPKVPKTKPAAPKKTSVKATSPKPAVAPLSAKAVSPAISEPAVVGDAAKDPTLPGDSTTVVSTGLADSNSKAQSVGIEFGGIEEPPSISGLQDSKVQDASKPHDTSRESLPMTTSPILAEVQKLKREKKIVAGGITSSKTTTTGLPPKVPMSAVPKSALSPSTKSPSSKKPTPISNPPPPPSPPTSSKPIPPKPRIPIAAINSDIVSTISTGAGARPNAGRSKELPSNYKTVSRKVTMAIVAMPIVIVTSYVLYQRLVLGEERKLLVNQPSTPVEPSPSPKAEATPETS